MEGELAALRSGATEVRDELARGSVDARVLAELGQTLAAQVGLVVRAVRQADDRRNLIDPCLDAWAEIEQVLNEADGVEGALATLELEQEAIDLYSLVGRLMVADLLAGIPIRQAAAATGLAQGYVSDLCRANKGLPSPGAAARLDGFLADRDASSDRAQVSTVVERTAARIEELRRVKRERRGQGASRNLPSGSARLELRIQAVNDAARRDPAFLVLAERYLGLPDRERRAVARLLEDLAEG